MRVVPVTSVEQQAALALQETCDLLVKQHRQLVTMISELACQVRDRRWRVVCTMPSIRQVALR